MVVNVAHSVLATGSDTRVVAFVAHASSVERTSIVGHALGLTEFLWISYVTRRTAAQTVITLRVHATG